VAIETIFLFLIGISLMLMVLRCWYDGNEPFLGLMIRPISRFVKKILATFF